MTTEDDDFLAGVFQEEVPEHLAPRRREFRAWHRERKQYIRIEQWNKEVENLIRRYLKLTTDPDDLVTTCQGEIVVPTPLKCLCLPGDDLLDIRSLLDHLEPHGCWIHYLGFNTFERAQNSTSRAHVAINEVNSHPRVARSSLVVNDLFQSIGNPKSIGHRRMREHGPFHVVNLDICDSIFPITGTDVSDYYEAVRQLVSYQCTNCSHPWLLFLTTQVDPTRKDIAQLVKLSRAVEENCHSSEEFHENMVRSFPETSYERDARCLQLDALSHDDLCKFFSVGLGKWLLKLVSLCTPPWSVHFLPSYYYTISDESADGGIEFGAVKMFSFAFLFCRTAPVTLRDRFGLASHEVAEDRVYDETKYGARILRRAVGIPAIEHLFAADPTTRARMIEEGAKLLESAGYDREAYLAYLNV